MSEKQYSQVVCPNCGESVAINVEEYNEGQETFNCDDCDAIVIVYKDESGFHVEDFIE